MAKSQRVLSFLVVPFVLAGLWLVYSSGLFAPNAGAEQTAGGDLQANLNQAADSIIAAAKQSVQAASSDDEAAQRMQIAAEALRLVGMLGDLDTTTQTEKLFDDVQSVARPALAATIVKLRLARQMQRWGELTPAAREKVVNRFVADAKQIGLTPELADHFMRFADRLETAEETELAKSAVNQLLPLFQNSSEVQVQRRAPLLEGFVRRLPGNRLELEGDLIDGSQLDWDSYRGKVVLVDFFASWCGPCRAEVPNILENYRNYRDKGFEVVGVNMDSNRSAAESYMRQAGFKFSTLFSDDPEATGWDHPMGRKYGVTALPRVILVDKDGKIVSTSARGQNLPRLLQSLLGPPSPSQDDSFGQTDRDTNVAPASFEEEAAPEVVDTAPAAVPEE